MQFPVFLNTPPSEPFWAAPQVLVLWVWVQVQPGIGLDHRDTWTIRLSFKFSNVCTSDFSILQRTEQNTQAIVKERILFFSGISRAPGQKALDIVQIISSLAHLALVMNGKINQMMKNIACSYQQFLAILCEYSQPHFLRNQMPNFDWFSIKNNHIIQESCTVTLPFLLIRLITMACSDCALAQAMRLLSLFVSFR